MNRRASHTGIADSVVRRHAGVLALAIFVALASTSIVFSETNAQGNPFETCNIGGFRNARIAWGDVERALAAPDASADVVVALTTEMQSVYRPDGSMDMHALEDLLTPELRKATGMDCSQVGTPPAPGAPIPSDRQVYVDHVRQVDPRTVSAFIVLPGMMAQPAPGATPGAQVGVSDGTPLPGTEIVDAVQFAIFVKQDDTWRISYLSFGTSVVFSDVAPKGQAPSDGFIGSWTYPAADLRDHGMPSVPEGSEVVASPVASPAS